ncbi:MAG: hypothetical protein QW267_02470 [Sulfolobales archaeon]
MPNQVNECKILFDSSVLLQVFEGIDVFELITNDVGKCRYYILDNILNELSRMSLNSRGPKGRAARLALEYINRRGVEVINTNLHELSGDESIIEFLKARPDRGEFVVATNDDGLKRELLDLGVKVLTWWSSKFKYVILNP